MMVDYLSSQLDWAGYQVSTKWGSGPNRPTSLLRQRYPNRVRTLDRNQKRPHEVTNRVPAPQHAERTHILLLNPTFWLFMFQLLYTFKGQLHNDLKQADLASVAALTAIHFHLIVNKRRRG